MKAVRFFHSSARLLYNSSQCYESFTRLYSQVCKNSDIFKIIGSLKYCQIHYAYAKKCKCFILKSKNKHKRIELDNT